MKRSALKPIKNKDITLLWFFLLGFLFVIAKLVLSRAQNVYLNPDGSGLDDMMMYNAAVSITKGEWLGSYDWMTLSKHSFYALWLAVMHWLQIPALLGGQLLWVAASFSTALAVFPFLKKRWLSLALFVVLLFNPASLANASPFGFTSRIYRDNIFPALCLLCVAGIIGFAFRYKNKLGKNIGWLILAGFSFAACWLCREDGWWLLPFVVVATIVMAVFILKDNTQGRIKRLVSLSIPFVLLLMGTMAWRTMNYAYYGRFIISDFSSGEFADAYGALTRVTSNETDTKQAVPEDVRKQLYELIPAFAELEPLLEDPSYAERYGNYNSGGFYWALREAAAEKGFYDTPQIAQSYFSSLAADINALCDEGVLPAGPKRSSVSPSIRAEYIGPVSKEAFDSLWFCLTFQDCSPRALFSQGSNDATFYTTKIQPMEEFLHEKAIVVTHPNSLDPVYTQFQNISYKILELIQRVYSVFVPLAFVAALVWQVWAGVQFLQRVKKKQKNTTESFLWLIQLGILFCIILRAYMIGFVSVVSFEIGTYIMYLASIHPLILLYVFCGVVALVRLIMERKSGTEKLVPVEGDNNE